MGVCIKYQGCLGEGGGRENSRRRWPLNCLLLDKEGFGGEGSGAGGELASLEAG